VKDHVTLKTGVMRINSALITGINYTLMYIHLENSYFKIVIIFHIFTVFFLYF